MLSKYYWIVLFTSFLNASIDYTEMKTEQPEPVIDSETIMLTDSCTPFPECKLY